MKLEGLIFDVDGTLAETEELHREAFNRAFAEAGLDWEWQRSLYGELLKTTGGKERMQRFASSCMGLKASARLDAQIAQIHRRKNDLYAQMVADGKAALRPGIQELIENARDSRVRLAIATTTSRSNVAALLNATLGPLGTSYFEVIAAGDSVKNKKPSPEIYQFVLDAMALPAAACLAVEDTVTGLQASLAAKIPTLMTISEYNKTEEFVGAVGVVTDCTMLVELFEKGSKYDAARLFSVLRSIHSGS